MGEMASIGRGVPNVDSFDKVLGRARYGTDIALPGMLHAKVLRSPLPHARILSVDTSRARGLPGVKTVLSGADTPGLKFGELNPDETILAVGKVRFVGEEVAVAVAIDEETALEALELIKVDYEPLVAVFDPEKAIKPGAPLIHEDFPNNIAYQYHIDRGDIGQGWKEAAVVAEGRFTAAASHQGYLEPQCCVASYEQGRVTVWYPSQSPFRDQGYIADGLGFPRHRVRFIQTFVGGGFGGKHGQRLPVLGGFIATRVEKPVRLSFSRDEEFIAGRPSIGCSIYMRLGLNREGVIVAKEAKVFGDNGAYTIFSPRILDTMTRRPDNLYRQRNIHNEALLVYTNKTPTGAYRGFGNPQGTFPLESLVDEAAHKLKMDPLTVRLKNATRAGDVTAHGWRPKSAGLVECLELAAERIGWGKKRTSKAPRDGTNNHIVSGVGLAGLIHVCGRRQMPTFYGSQAMVRVNMDGAITLITGEADLGQGSNTIFAQIAAEEMGLPFEDVMVQTQVDTDTSPQGLGTFSDRLTSIGGNAVKLAAADAKRQLLDFASEMLEATADDLEIRAGMVMVKGSPARAVPVKELAGYASKRRGGALILGVGVYDPPSEFPDPKTLYGNISTSYAMGAQAVEVEVNTETGEIKVLNLVSVHDAGKVINPLLASGQIEGAVAQGVGAALLEEIAYKNGKVINPSLLCYGETRIGSMPSMEVHFVETVEPMGPFGAKGLAEPAIVPTAAAVANAVRHATGIRLHRVPFRPTELLSGIRGAAKKRPSV
ncbi:MAG: xanthine dehydrogenase family protein molybdopterin-binding subunit [Deltaproteobacteria bacterium]|nr:xanthine dehydrogenase family protein molybdopterin-binding subunit [Deltaproteobacteria bacterium]